MTCAYFVLSNITSLIVDVKLSAAKTAKIHISRGDDPAALAGSFARIYSLDRKAELLLVSVIHQSMVDNGLADPPLNPQQEQDDLNRSQSAERSAWGDGRASSGEYGDGGLLLGQDTLYVEDEYDSQSSVSDSNDLDGSQGSEDEDGSSRSSGSISGKDSAYLTA